MAQDGNSGAIGGSAAAPQRIRTGGDGLRRHPLSAVIAGFYRAGRARRRMLNLVGRLEGGQMWSATLRDILRRFHNVEIAPFSYGACFEPGAFPGGARIGRYASIAGDVKRRLNHPVDRLVMHPLFYNEMLGFVPARTISHEPIEIGHDAWIGDGTIFTEGCGRVGIGAVIGAGSIVTHDVGDFDIVAGSPAKRLRRRFPDPVCERILASRWWDRAPPELATHIHDLGIPVERWTDHHPLLAPKLALAR